MYTFPHNQRYLISESELLIQISVYGYGISGNFHDRLCNIILYYLTTHSHCMTACTHYKLQYTEIQNIKIRQLQLTINTENCRFEISPLLSGS